MILSLEQRNLVLILFLHSMWHCPHARPEAGALESAIGVATLATPVEFGSKANDPVKYLFCLSARNNTEHLDALADLAERLEDQEFFKMLDQATDPKEVLDYLSK